MQDKINQALETLGKASGKSFIKPLKADDAAIQMCNTLLTKRGYAPLPQDYAALLREAGGIAGPYFILFGIGGMELAGGAFQPGLLDESDKFNEMSGKDDDLKTLVVGRMSGNALVIHDGGKYQVIDAATSDVFRSYDDIAAFITDTIAKKDAATAASG